VRFSLRIAGNSTTTPSTCRNYFSIPICQPTGDSNQADQELYKEQHIVVVLKLAGKVFIKDDSLINWLSFDNVREIMEGLIENNLRHR